MHETWTDCPTEAGYLVKVKARRQGYRAEQLGELLDSERLGGTLDTWTQKVKHILALVGGHVRRLK